MGDRRRADEALGLHSNAVREQLRALSAEGAVGAEREAPGRRGRPAVREASGGRLVCALHRGISRGLLELTPTGRLTGFEARPPRAAGCRIAGAGLAPPGPPPS